jgi:hypothetical protein
MLLQYMLPAVKYRLRGQGLFLRRRRIEQLSSWPSSLIGGTTDATSSDRADAISLRSISSARPNIIGTGLRNARVRARNTESYQISASRSI